MRKAISILDNDYKQWLSELSSRYRRSQIKAEVPDHKGGVRGIPSKQKY